MSFESPRKSLENPRNSSWYDCSVEFCGGTHVEKTGDIGSFKIISESSLSTGVRRIEAITGKKYMDFMDEKLTLLNQLKNKLNCADAEILEKVKTIFDKCSYLKKIVVMDNSFEGNDDYVDNLNSFLVFDKELIDSYEVNRMPPLPRPQLLLDLLLLKLLL